MQARLASCVLVLVSACGGGEKSPQGRVKAENTRPTPQMVEKAVSADDFPETWPLTVERGTLRCEPPGAVSFETPDGRRFRVNGLAAKYPKINPIWAKDPEAEPGIDLRINISPLIDAGLELCKELDSSS